MNVLYLYIGDPTEPKELFCNPQAKKAGINIIKKAIPYNKGLGLIISAFKVSLGANQYDMVVTTEYFTSFGVNLKLLFCSNKIRHVVYGINQSARLLVFQNKLINKLINRVFNKADFFITHSREEMRLFQRIHDIDNKKFGFSHWGFDLPKIRNDIFSNRKKKFLSFVGRNNRDILTFCNAIKDLDVNGIIITAKYNAPNFSLPENVEIHYDLDMDACLSCIKHAFCNVVLVRDGNRGAGHITMVAAMFMGKPQIISDVAVVKDYFIHQKHGISVPIADVNSVKDAIRQLENESVANSYGEEARSYANRYFINDEVARRFVDILQAVSQGIQPEVCDSNWVQEYNALTK